jgi:hypothetical protein
MVGYWSSIYASSEFGAPLIDEADAICGPSSSGLGQLEAKLLLSRTKNFANILGRSRGPHEGVRIDREEDFESMPASYCAELCVTGTRDRK